MIFIQRSGNNMETVRRAITDVLARGYEITYIEVGNGSLIPQIKGTYPPNLTFLQSLDQDPRIINIVCLGQAQSGRTIVRMISMVTINDR